MGFGRIATYCIPCTFYYSTIGRIPYTMYSIPCTIYGILCAPGYSVHITYHIPDIRYYQLYTIHYVWPLGLGALSLCALLGVPTADPEVIPRLESLRSVAVPATAMYSAARPGVSRVCAGCARQYVPEGRDTSSAVEELYVDTYIHTEIYRCLLQEQIFIFDDVLEAKTS